MMPSDPDTMTLPRADDLHVHLRQGELMKTAVAATEAGGVGRCLVMPNTRSPVCTVEQAMAYRDELLRENDRLEYLMTLYLSPQTTPEELRRAARAGIAGVKCYPQGVTTNSDQGVSDLARYDPVFAAMSDEGLVLELHGECASCHADDTCVLNAEQRFLPELGRLHDAFPALRIVLEHVTSAAAVAKVKELGDTVAATVTAHHLELVVDDWAGRNHNFCKPVAKLPSDRDALRKVVGEGHPRFFLGSDSAPHPASAKECAEACAGVFTAHLLLPYLADTFDRLGSLERLRDFTSSFGQRFYGLGDAGGRVTLVREEQTVPERYGNCVPFRAGETLTWSLRA
jgi:dihydroorotase